MAKTTETHENYGSKEEIKRSSERSFSIVFAVVFAIVGLAPLLDERNVRFWSLGIAAVFLLAGFLCPRLLAPLNKLWFHFGLLLNKVTNPIIMGIVFFGVVTPTAMIMRLMGKDPLRRRFDPEVRSYWLERDPPGPEPNTMKNQF